MARITILLIVTFLIGKLNAQPGGGGGLIIRDYYTKNLEPINVKDSSFIVRVFALADSSLNSKILHEILPADCHRLETSFSSTYPIRNYFFLKNQRMLVLYKKDTMVIDFLDMLPENGAGITHDMDSIIVQPGHYRCFNILTKYATNIHTSFLLEANLPATFYLRRGAYAVREKKAKSALADLNKSIKMGLERIETEEALFLLTQAYTLDNQYSKAIEYITTLINDQAINRSNKYENDDAPIVYYKTRIDLYTRTKQLDKALDDYKTLVSISYFQTNAIIGMATFKIKCLKDYKGAISDLKSIIEEVPDINPYPEGRSQYGETYFTLALAEYYNGQRQLAFRHWLKAEELRFADDHNSYKVVVHFDSLIKKHPKTPELYFSRGIAYSFISYSSGDESKKKYFTNALQDIDKAEKFGFTDFRINLYRARIFAAQKRYEEALEQINLALSKNKSDPRIYINRYRIRDKMKQAKQYNTDPDVIQYNELLKTWKFDKD